MRLLAWVNVVLGFALSSTAATSSVLGIKAGKLAITTTDGLGDVSYTLDEPAPLPSPIMLGQTSTLKLTFTVVDTSRGEAILPQQAHLLFENGKGQDVTLAVNVNSNGRASFTINTANPPTPLLYTQGTLEMTLLLSTLSPSSVPLSYPIGQISLPSSILRPVPSKRHDLPPRQGEPAFQPEQELFHTFRQDEKTVGPLKSAVGTALVLVPWLVLTILYAKVAPNVDFLSPPSSSYVFLACLAGIEAMILTYWVGLRLYQFLPIFLASSLVSAYVGRTALRGFRDRRLQST